MPGGPADEAGPLTWAHVRRRALPLNHWKGGSNCLRWWTRTQRIRTAAEIPFEAALLETAEPPLYQRIAPKAMRLWKLGLSLSRIARHLGVTDKTVAKSLCACRHSDAVR